MSDPARLPDTKLVIEAASLVERALSPGVFNHSVRTYGLARAYAETKAISCDSEELALASLFHDLGTAPAYAHPGKPFTYASARALRLFAEERGVPPPRVEPMVDAIAFHMHLLPKWSAGPVAGLLQVGAWMDVTALRRWSVWGASKALAAAHPRTGFDWEFVKVLAGQSWPPGKAFRLVFPGDSRG